MLCVCGSMIHGLRIKDGKATYVSRYVKTSRMKQEETFGGAKFMKVCILASTEINFLLLSSPVFKMVI